MPGPSADRDPAYRLHSTKQGQVPTILCKVCNENPPIKSNASIVSEINRLKDFGGMLSAVEEVGCVNPNCPSYELSPADAPKQYRRCGISAQGLVRYQCKSCGGYFRQRRRVSLDLDKQRQAADVFSRIANKSPVRGTIRCARLASSEAYYRIVDFIHDRCRAFNAFECPIGTSSGQNTVWHGYQPYNPALVEKYLCIFRVVNNFITVGTDDSKTPAMRRQQFSRPMGIAPQELDDDRHGRFFSEMPSNLSV